MTEKHATQCGSNRCFRQSITGPVWRRRESRMTGTDDYTNDPVKLAYGSQRLIREEGNDVRRTIGHDQ